jgi:Rrf2 family transcriptional regulator, cysteine metabolism repressor
MNFTAKEDYGLRAVLDLAVNTGAGPVQTREIAARQRIPEQFLEQLLASLRRAEVVRSTRGAGGGYSLATTPDKITVGKVLRALSGPLVPTELVTGDNDTGTRDLPEATVVRGVWESIRAAIREVADKTTLQDLLDRRAENQRDVSYMMHI